MLELEHKKRIKERLSEIDGEIKNREAEIRKELEPAYNKRYEERVKAMETELKKKEETIRKSLEDEFNRKADTLSKKLEEEARKIEKEGAKVALEYKKHLKEELTRIDTDMRKREEEFKKLNAALKKEKDTELLEAYKIIDVQSDILMKILEKDESLMLRILSDLKLTTDDLKKIMGG